MNSQEFNTGLLLFFPDALLSLSAFPVLWLRRLMCMPLPFPRRRLENFAGQGNRIKLHPSDAAPRYRASSYTQLVTGYHTFSLTLFAFHFILIVYISYRAL